MKIRSKKIRDAARLEECTLNIAGVCNYDPATTVFAHFSLEGGIMGSKPDDISGCFACSSCHDEIDGRATASDMGDSDDYFYKLRGVLRTLKRLVEMDVIKIKGMK